MAIELLCKKLGMTQIFADSGEAIPVTVLEAGPNYVVQKKSEDKDGYTAVHHSAARGDNETIIYLVEKGADVTLISRRGQTTADMANGPVSRVSPIPETVALLESLGSANSNNCVSCQ